jgi:hypothetical protein
VCQLLVLRVQGGWLFEAEAVGARGRYNVARSDPFKAAIVPIAGTPQRTAQGELALEQLIATLTARGWYPTQQPISSWFNYTFDRPWTEAGQQRDQLNLPPVKTIARTGGGCCGMLVVLPITLVPVLIYLRFRRRSGR